LQLEDIEAIKILKVRYGYYCDDSYGARALLRKAPLHARGGADCTLRVSRPIDSPRRQF
jgi:hypothetical protein